jgi:hypothetical protein
MKRVTKTSLESSTALVCSLDEAVLTSWNYDSLYTRFDENSHPSIRNRILINNCMNVIIPSKNRLQSHVCVAPYLAFLFLFLLFSIAETKNIRRGPSHTSRVGGGRQSCCLW